MTNPRELELALKRVENHAPQEQAAADPTLADSLASLEQAITEYTGLTRERRLGKFGIRATITPEANKLRIWQSVSEIHFLVDTGKQGAGNLAVPLTEAAADILNAHLGSDELSKLATEIQVYGGSEHVAQLPLLAAPTIFETDAI